MAPEHKHDDTALRTHGQMDGLFPLANPVILLREEFDDWAVLFDPDTCRGFGLNPTGVSLWKQFDGHHSIAELVSGSGPATGEAALKNCEEIERFVSELAEYGLVDFSVEKGNTARPSLTHSKDEDVPPPEQTFNDAPRLEVFTGERAAGSCAYGSFAANTNCGNGNGAACSQGAHVGTPCGAGNDAGLCSNGNAFLLPACNMGTLR